MSAGRFLATRALNPLPLPADHFGEDGWSAPVLMAMSGTENLRALGVYVNPGDEAVAAVLACGDPGRRRR